MGDGSLVVVKYVFVPSLMCGLKKKNFGLCDTVSASRPRMGVGNEYSRFYAVFSGYNSGRVSVF